MIESRYKIEYVLPERKQQKSNSFKFVAYFSFLLMVGALASVFAITSLSNESLALFNKMKNKVLAINIDQADQNEDNKEYKSEYFLAAVPDPIPVPDTTEEVGYNTELPEDVVLETEEVEVEVAEVASHEEITIQTNTNNDTVDEIVENIEESKPKIKEVILASTEKQAQSLNLEKERSSEINKDTQLENTPVIQKKTRKERIANLVSSALKNVDTNEKEYITAINTSANKNESNKTVYLTNTVNIKPTGTKNSKDVNQAISEEKSSEIDAIIAAMKGESSKKDIEPITYQTKIQQQIDKLVSNTTENVKNN